jgi:hypothetical protein
MLDLIISNSYNKSDFIIWLLHIREMMQILKKRKIEKLLSVLAIAIFYHKK